MRKFSFDNPEIMNMLNHQVIHMDQGVTYNPEYIATREMRFYPSRVAQIIRAVYNGELEASEYGANTVFAPILSGQGERWQNFGEDQNSYLLSLILGREMFIEKGFFQKEAAELLKKRIGISSDSNDDASAIASVWERELPLSKESHTGLLIDDVTFFLGEGTENRTGTFLREKGITVIPEFGPYFTGFDFLAAGLVEKAREVIRDLLVKWESLKITRMITLTGQSQYLFTVLLPYLELETGIEFISILDLADTMDVKNAYIYGGSFFTRYLRMDKKLNELTSSENEAAITSCPEFLPEIKGEKRRNIVGIWTPPLSCEYDPVGTPDELLDSIYDLSLNTIQNASFHQLVVCDPYAYNCLLKHGYPKKKLAYFLNLLK